MLDPEVFGEAMADMVREIVAPLRREVSELREQLAKRQDVGAEIAAQVKAAISAMPTPRDGRDVDPELLRATVAEHVARAVAEIPRPADGKNADPAETVRLVAEAVAALPKPADGKSVTLEDVRPVLDEAIKAVQEEARRAVDTAVKAIPAPRDGKDCDMQDVKAMVAQAVEALPRPADGKSVTMDELRPVVSQAVQEAVKSLPPPEPGKSVTVDELMPAVRSAVQTAVKELPAPVSVAHVMLSQQGDLVATMTNGDVKTIGHVVGKDGVDGMSFDGFDMEYLAETHEVSIKATCAGRTKEIRFDAGGIRPGEYWRDGTHSKACEAWSCDGSLWIAKRDTKTRPGPKAEDWVLAARKGRDGESVVRQVKDGPEPPIKLGGGEEK